MKHEGRIQSYLKCLGHFFTGKAFANQWHDGPNTFADSENEDDENEDMPAKRAKPDDSEKKKTEKNGHRHTISVQQTPNLILLTWDFSPPSEMWQKKICQKNNLTFV